MARGANTTAQKGRDAPVRDVGMATFLIGVFMVALAIFLGGALLAIWPLATIDDGRTVWLNLTEARAMLIAMLAGAIGSYIHAATSFTSFAGNRRLVRSWIWWFLLRPAIAAVLAVSVYFLVRSGLLLYGPLGETMSPFGIAGLCAVVGLFSKQAVDKMKTVSDTALASTPDEERHDKL
ncbi:MAG: hypothetical protein QNJ92_01155 [Alphaproteobacteria bacterium]|nr:hypothetical protein [Alphaproteobacteria bacterium]